MAQAVTSHRAFQKESDALASLKFHIKFELKKANPAPTDEEIRLIAAEFIKDLAPRLKKEVIQGKLVHVRKS